MAYVSAATSSTIVTKISRKLIDQNNTAVAVTSVQDAVQDALHFWKQKRFWFNEAATTFNLDISPALDGSASSDPFILGYGNTNALYPHAPVLPQNFGWEFPEDGFVIKYSNLSYRFDKVSPAKYDDTNIQGVGLPYIYTFRQGNYEFYFYPNLAYSMTCNYIMDVPDFTFNAGETNIFTQYADRLITYEALSHLFGEDREDPDSDTKYSAKADKEFTMLKTRGSQNVASGKLSYSSILE
jgi:hypothetical protein